MLEARIGIEGNKAASILLLCHNKFNGVKAKPFSNLFGSVFFQIESITVQNVFDNDSNNINNKISVPSCAYQSTHTSLFVEIL
jgi:hypothetical protein